MKIKIGPYKNWFGPYQLAELLCFWAKEVPDEYGIKNKPKFVFDFGTFLAHGFDKEKKKETKLYKFLQWIDTKKKRKIKIKIHNYDTWGMDSTLAMIILPMLIQLNNEKHGSPFVDDEDVPEELKSTSAPPTENEWDTDNYFHARWTWVMNEIIWTFKQLQPDCDWEEQYCSGYIGDLNPNKESGEPLFINSTYKMDLEGIKKHDDKIKNGLRLFGKYFRALWD